MAPLTHTPFDDYTASSIWPRPIFLLAAGSVTLLLYLIILRRRKLISRRYLRYVSDSDSDGNDNGNDIDMKIKPDDQVPFSDLPPPLRSIYHHPEGVGETNKSSTALVAEAATRQLVVGKGAPTIMSGEMVATMRQVNRRHSCPYPTSLVPSEYGMTTMEEPMIYSELKHDSVQFFPVLNEQGLEVTEGSGYWRRRTLIYA